MLETHKNSNVYGAIKTNDFINYIGFCKQINSTTIQRVEVFINNQKVDTITANETNREIENLYEVFDTIGHCLSYQLPDEYINKQCVIEFKNELEEHLLNSPISK